MTRRSLKEIAVIFIFCYAFIFLFISQRQTTRLQHDTLNQFHPFELLSSFSQSPNKDHEHASISDDSDHPTQETNLPLTAHLYINGTHTLVNFQLEQTQKQTNARSHGIHDIRQFPVIDDYPDGDAYLPWIHDVFPSPGNNSNIIILAQNRRRCHTGKNNEHVMKQMEPQIALFQPISLREKDEAQSSNIKLNRNKVKGQKEAKTYFISNDEDATIRETRFQCRFKLYQKTKHQSESSPHPNLKRLHQALTFSQYPFNYEYITWRKVMAGMYETKGKGMAQFWLSSLEFHCPIPPQIRTMIHERNNDDLHLYLDVATIRTPPRGIEEWSIKEVGEDKMFDVYQAWGEHLPMEKLEDTTRWENIHIPISTFQKKVEYERTDNDKDKVNHDHDHDNTKIQPNKKPHRLVACTWSSATHNRRGDAVTLRDGKERLKEWIAFKLIVGFDHVVVYDNSAANSNSTDLKDVTDLFDSKSVTHVDWPCKLCNNNRPAHDDPGERSSQYAAEASCRARFGPGTDWMAFIDPDEYLVPMGKFDSWKPFLDEVDAKEGRKILKFRSTRARPRSSLLDPTYDYEDCPSREEVADKKKPGISSCVAPRQNETFLNTYNCEYIKSPKPDRFQRAMKQMYRPDFVLSHFVHYSTINADLAKRKEDTIGNYRRTATNNPNTERFVDELSEGVMIHAKSITPRDGVNRVTRCIFKKTLCNIGYECPDELPFSDETHKDGFQFENGTFCNCWVNQKVERYWNPQLEKALRELQ